MIKSKAFTLAEILITLGIIGVIAAMTLPSVVNKYKRIVKVQQLKKIYATMTQLDRRAKADYGDSLICPHNQVRCTPDTNEFFDLYIIPYLNPAKICLNNGDCPYYRVGAETGNIVDMSNEKGFMLQDGTLVKIVNIHGDASGFFAMWLIDINGVKGPNYVNKDVYFAEFGINTDRVDGLTDEGVKDGSSLFYFSINVPGEHYDGIGSGCFKEIVRSGWKNPKDYNYCL